MSGELASGERLVEERLSEEFAVSRMPVREALRQLASSGLVIIEPRRGASVAKFHGDLLRELVDAGELAYDARGNVALVKQA